MRATTLVLAAALATPLIAAPALASAAGAKNCAAQWSVLKKAGTSGSQTRAQFMTTCKAAGQPGGAPKPITPNGGKP